MSKVSITGNNAGTGTFTIAAPNSNTNRTLTLPDEAGTALTDATDLEPQVKTSLNATGSAPVYACRAWVNFNGRNTVSIRESGNVSSITDLGTGDFDVNFATNMPDNAYARVASAGESRFHFVTTFSPAQASLEVVVSGTNDGAITDDEAISVAVFR